MGLGELCQQGCDRLGDEADAFFDVAGLEDLLTFLRADGASSAETCKAKSGCRSRTLAATRVAQAIMARMSDDDAAPKSSIGSARAQR
jgi:hypothetical protein